MPASIPSTASPAGRPKKIERPIWHGTVLSQHPSSPYISKTRDERPIVLPPHTSESAFETALRELRELLGEEWVKCNDVALVDGDYHAVPLSHDAYHILEQDDLVPSAVCWPKDTEQVATVVKWANRHKIPIWPISIGRYVCRGK